MFQKNVFDTLSCVPIKQITADLNLYIPCVFENRRKLLCALEELLLIEGCTLRGTIEFDETYELKSVKGSKNIKRKARKRGGLPTIEEYFMNKYVSSPQQIEMDMRFSKQSVMEN